ncbi:MAG: YceI family protein [Gaiella sp.]|nr:YceI family protein [Gaiella sp.]
MTTIATAPETALLAPGSWHVDPAHSSVEFQVKHLMIATVKGRFTDFTGTLEALEDGTLRATGTIQAASIDTHEPKRDEHLRSADFFEADAYPEITFASTEIVPAAKGDFRVLGDLTIRGITKPVELTGGIEGSGRDPWGNDRVALQVRGTINRSDWGLTWNQALEAGGVLVGDKVKLELELSTVKPAASAAA